MSDNHENVAEKVEDLLCQLRSVEVPIKVIRTSSEALEAFKERSHIFKSALNAIQDRDDSVTTTWSKWPKWPKWTSWYDQW